MIQSAMLLPEDEKQSQKQQAADENEQVQIRFNCHFPFLMYRWQKNRMNEA